MKHGGFDSQNLLDDALTIAIVESRVALRAFDADRVTGRAGHPADRAGRGARGPARASCPPGTLVIADEERPLALLFGATGDGRGVQPRTKRTLLVRDRGRRACPRSRSRRRSGWRPESCEG